VGRTDTAGTAYNVTVDQGLNVLAAANVNVTAQNGLGGNIALNAQPGYQLGPEQIGYGAIQLNAYGSSNQVLGLGGKIDINAYSGGLGEYGSATSRVSVSSATIALSAGAAPTLPGLAGSMNIFGQGAVSIVASLIPPVLPQFPETVYLYGLGIPGTAGGVRMESPNGIQALSDFYAGTVYPLDGGGLNLKGRSLPTGYVNIQDVASFVMNPSAILQTDVINSVSSSGVVVGDTLRAQGAGGINTTVIKPPLAIGVGNPNLTLSGNAFAGNQNYVIIQNADSIAFDAGGTGALTGVQSINGAVWPPPTGDASLWAAYPATQTVNLVSHGITACGPITGLTSINGVTYAGPSQWSTFPAVQAVDMASNGITNLASITTPDGFTLTSAGSVGIFADTSGGNISIATNGGGAVNIGTGNAGDINILTSGALHDLNLGGDTVTVSATVGLQVNADTTVGSVGSPLALSVYGNINATETITATVAVQTPEVYSGADILLQGQNDVNVRAIAGAVNITGFSEIRMTAPNIYGVGAYTGNSVSATGDVISSSATTPYSLNTIGGLVAGIPSGFRDATEFYVSANGSDITGSGGILSPYATIQKAITQAELISSAALVCVINVASGHYTENLTFNKGYVILNGTLQGQNGDEVCEIIGSISIACVGANDVFNRQVAFQGFNISCGVGQSITNTSSSSHTVSFQDCSIYVNSVAYNSTASSVDARTYFTNVDVYSTNAANVSPVITTNVGQVELERMDVTVDGNAIALLIGGTSVLTRFSLSTLESTSTATTLRPLLSFTSTSTSAHSLALISFVFTSSVAKTATNAVYINSGITTAINALNCVFILAGTASSTNNCIGYNGVGSPTIAGINNTSLNINVLLPQTTSVQSGITQIQYTNIQPPGLATYSSTVDQAIAVSGTPQALTYNTTQFNNGTTLVANSRVYVTAQGNYNLNYSVELQHAGAGATQIATTFLKKNGTTIANTGRQWSITSGSFQNAATAEFVVSLNAGDYVEVFFNGDTSLSANATAAAGALPAIPSVVFNIKQFR
jgi:hypothetical protein